MKKPIYKDRFRNVLIDAIERRMVRQHHFEPFIQSVIEDFAPLLSDEQLHAISISIDGIAQHNANVCNHKEWYNCASELHQILLSRKNQQHEAENHN
jgi:hypothetical protein